MFEDPVSLDAASLIPQLAEAGVTALKIEGRQRSRAYTVAVVGGFRAALDAYAAAADRRERAARSDRGAENHRGGLSQGLALITSGASVRAPKVPSPRLRGEG